MQTRPYPEKDGRRVWLSRREQNRLVDYYAENPLKELTVRLGLCGLRGEEILRVCRADVRALDGEGAYKLVIPQAKRGPRETPLPAATRQLLVTTANARGTPQDEPAIGRDATRTVQRWIEAAGEHLAGEASEPDAWEQLRLHDLRRTWATDTYYSLAFNGVPIAEHLTMGWGG